VSSPARSGLDLPTNAGTPERSGEGSPSLGWGVNRNAEAEAEVVLGVLEDAIWADASVAASWF
jgi:hypothetical protein